MRNVKFIWEFRGTNANGIAEHHVIHLNDFGSAHLSFHEAGIEEEEGLVIAFVVVKETEAEKVHEALKPLRGFFLSNE